METIILSILGFYLLMHFVMFIGLLINSKKPKDNSYEPTVSIIICAKDEESCIEDCIKSLIDIDYPKDKMEVVLVNDRSSDKTGEIMQRYVSEHKFLKYLAAVESTGKLKGKANALEQALRTVTGEIVFTTDADIEVNKKWVREIVKYYDDKTGVVSGYSVIEPKNLFWGLQSIDWLYLLSVASGGDGLKIPISCVGNNMSYRKKAYDEVGGYEKIPFSVTEDFMLLQKIHYDGGYNTKFPVNDETKNITLPCLTINQLLSQKKRWAAGGIGAMNYGMLVGAFSWLMGAILLSGWAYLDMQVYFAFCITKLVSDFVFLFPAVKEFKMYKVYLYILFFEIYFAVYVIVTSVLLIMSRKVVWKNQKI